jgi:hypothetical protein
VDDFERGNGYVRIAVYDAWLYLDAVNRNVDERGAQVIHEVRDRPVPVWLLCVERSALGWGWTVYRQRVLTCRGRQREPGRSVIVIREQRGKTSRVVPMKVGNEHGAKSTDLQSCQLRAAFKIRRSTPGPASKM